MSEKHLLPTEDYVNAKNISLFVNSELSSEVNLLRPDKADNIFDFTQKFDEERNSSTKFCLYGIIESKWADTNNVRIKFSIGDSSTNVGTQIKKFPFFVYDKTSNISGLTWTTISRPLDNFSGSLTKNLYGKIKGSYFFPFEIDFNFLTKTNKSIYAEVLEVEYNIGIIEEFPFLFFDEDGVLIEYGTESAQILDDGNVIELNNNYPFFYDRHWIRREIEPTGPARVFFTEKQITIEEGGLSDRTRQDKIFNLEISLDKKPKGYEQVKLQILYGLDENDNEYTTVKLPQDLILNLNTIEWNGPDADIVQNVVIQIQDDFLVEPLERISLKIVPIVGVMADLEKPQIISLYIKDNDVPSKVAFKGQSYEFTEPRQDIFPLEINLSLILNQTILAPDQSVEVYIDEQETDCKSIFGFKANPGYNFSTNLKIRFNETDLEFPFKLYFLPERINDIQRKIVLRLRNFTPNVILGTFGTNQDTKFTLYVNKNLDKKYVEISIPYDTSAGKAVMRSAMNKPFNLNPLNLSYSSLRDTPTRLETYNGSFEGNVVPNTQLTGNTSPLLLKSLVYEPSFKIIIRNSGSNMIFDNHLYENNQELHVMVTSGFTTGVSTDQFVFDGKRFILRLPANDEFDDSPLPNIFVNSAINNLFLGQTWGFTRAYYQIYIENLTYNYVAGTNTDSPLFNYTNKLNRQFFTAEKTGNTLSLASYTIGNYFDVPCGTDTNKVTYNAITQLARCYSQILFNGTDLLSYSGTSINYTELSLFYPGILILPPYTTTTFGVPPLKPTLNRLLLTRDNIALENSLISGATNSLNLPVSNILLSPPFSQFRKKIRFNFGNLLVQAGYLFAPVTTTFVGGQTTSVANDGFVLATVDYSNSVSSDLKKRFLYKWSQANSNTKNQAVIEIYNDGLVPVEILGKTINPDEKLWISETPLIINNTGIQNIVRPLANLTMDLETNSNYLYTKKIISGTSTKYKLFNAFEKAKYKISFLNFVIYNPDGTPTGKVVNKSMNIEIPINAIFPTSNTQPPIFPVQNRYLLTKYSNQIYAPANNSGLFVCNGSQVTNLRKISSAVSNNGSVWIQGFIASPSTWGTVMAMAFGTVQIVPGDRCTSFGFSWVKT